MHLVATTTKYHYTLLELKAIKEGNVKPIIDLIVVRNLVSENALFAEHTKEELYETSTELMAANEETAILKAMSLLNEMQSTLEEYATQKRSLQAKNRVISKGCREM
jgi:hypothetical protein